MNEHLNITESQWQETAKKFGYFVFGASTLALIFLIAEKNGYAKLRIGRPSPFEDLKVPAAAITSSLIKSCLENIDPKEIAGVIVKNLPKG